MKMQEVGAIKREQARRATEQKILDEELQTLKESAENVRETNKQNAISGAEANFRQAEILEDYNKRMLLELMNGEKEKWLAAINTTFSHIEGLHVLAIGNYYGIMHLLPTTIMELISKSVILLQYFCLLF